MADPLLASELFALANGLHCSGPQRCHWCGAAAGTDWPHDDLPALVGVRRLAARCPASHWICAGCMSWRRKSMTVCFLHGGFRDRQCAMNHSWWLTPSAARGLLFPEGRGILYEQLLDPPSIFSLSVITSGQQNFLQFNTVNMSSSPAEVPTTTPLHFTLNGVPHSYSTYELEQGLRYGAEGKEPGVQALIRTLGSWTLPAKDDPPSPRVGRPKKVYEGPPRSLRSGA